MSEEASPSITIAIEIADPVLADRLASLLGGVAGLSLVARGDPADVTLTARQAQTGIDAQDAELTPRELRDVDIARRQRNFSDCTNGWTCDRSMLTRWQIAEVDSAEHQGNAQNCKDGWGNCDHSRLSVSEARETAIAEHQRNLSVCKK